MTDEEMWPFFRKATTPNTTVARRSRCKPHWL